MSKPVTRSAPTVGDLVRHLPTGGIGLIIEHTMYDARWGGYRVKFNHPVENRSSFDGKLINHLDHMFDRADRFEKLS